MTDLVQIQQHSLDDGKTWSEPTHRLVPHANRRRILDRAANNPKFEHGEHGWLIERTHFPPSKPHDLAEFDYLVRLRWDDPRLYPEITS